MQLHNTFKRKRAAFWAACALLFFIAVGAHRLSAFIGFAVLWFVIRWTVRYSRSSLAQRSTDEQAEEAGARLPAEIAAARLALAEKRAEQSERRIQLAERRQALAEQRLKEEQS